MLPVVRLPRGQPLLLSRAVPDERPEDGTEGLAHSVKCGAQPSTQKGMLSELEILRCV